MIKSKPIDIWHRIIPDYIFITLGSLLLIGLSIVAFYPAFNNNFVNWDDQFYVTANPLIYNPSWDSFKVLFTKIVSLNYHPITMLSLWINAKLSGIDSAAPFIITNVTIHILNALLVFLLIFRITNKKAIVAFVTALVFAIHPMHVESVVWVSERKDVLYGFFFLAASIGYWSYLNTQKHFYLFICFVLFLLASLSKAMAVSLVPCLFLFDYLKGRNFFCFNV